ncbi:MAG: PAS domain S-box protein [Gammaproteobacteria bacterium]|nr:PAS domain S-box protein [Gammaproteobacteria bacterium]MCP5199018.1 PAS domain S-box protein [Gammaproteobacteria bacterium]
MNSELPGPRVVQFRDPGDAGDDWFEAAPTALVLAAADLGVLRVNRSAARLLRRMAAACRGQLLTALLPGLAAVDCAAVLAGAAAEHELTLPLPGNEHGDHLQVRLAACTLAQGAAALIASLSVLPARPTAPFRNRDVLLHDVDLLVDHLPVFIAYYDRDWRYRFVNARYEMWLGQPREWFVGRAIAEVVSDDTFATIAPYIRDALRGHAVSFEFVRTMPQDHGERHLVCHLVPDRRAGGGVDGVFALYEDITERRQAEAAALQAQWEMRAVADHLPALVAYIDRDLRYRYVNRRFEEWYEKPQAWFIGRPVEEVVGAAFELTGPLLRRAAAGEFLRFDYARHNPLFANPERTLRVHLVPDPARANGGFIALMEDVTEQLVADTAQRRATAEIRNVIDTVPALLAAYDMDTRLIFANETFVEYMGVDGVTLPGQRLDALFPSEVMAQIAPALAAVLAGRPVAVQGQVVARRDRSGDSGYHHVEFRPLVEDGVQRGFIAIAMDVTDTVLALRAVREQEALLRQITEGSSEGFLLSDAERRHWLYVSPAVERMWPGARAGATWLDGVHGDDRERVRAQFAGTLTRGSFEARYRVVGAGGQTRWIHDKANVVRTPDGSGIRLASVLSDVTDSVEQEAALERHGRRLAEAQRAGQLGLWELDVDSGSIYWSRQLKRLFELEHEDLAIDADTYTRFIHPDDVGYVLQRVDLALQGEQDYDVEHRACLASGRVLHLLSQARVERHADGRPARMVGIVRDITAQKAAESALKNSEERLRRITETIADVFWLIEVGRPESMYVSPGFHSIYGRDIDEAGGDPASWLGWVHADDRARMAPLFEDLKDGRDYQAEYRVLRPDGSERWVLEKAHVVPHSSPGAPLVAGLTTDITVRKQAEMALAANEAMLRQITENTRDLFWLMDAERGEVVYVGHGYERIWGYPVEQAVDAVPWLDRLHEDDAPMLRRARVSLLTTGTVDVEYRILRGDGEPRWLHTRAFPIRGEGGALARIAGFTEDITDSRSVQELRRLKDEAESASRTKSEFLSRMSHELRTPLNAVLGFAQLLLVDPEAALAQGPRENVGEILKAGRHLLDIVDEMLDLTRIEMGQLRIELEAVDVNGVVTECLPMVQAQAAARGIVMRRADGAGTPPGHAIADRTRVRQILLNLLSNAIKYNVEGGTVTVEVRRVHEHVLRLSVSDTGPGLSETELEQLFVPFRRLETARTSSEGIGLGLALSKQLAEAMGGAIGARGGPGEGATFWLELPCT